MNSVEKLYNLIQKEGIQEFESFEELLQKKYSQQYEFIGYLKKYEIISCLYLVAIDAEDVNFVIQLNEKYKNSLKNSTEICGFVNILYRRGLLNKERFKKLNLIISRLKLKFIISSDLIISITFNKDLKLLKNIYNKFIFSNSSILKLLYWYKQKKAISNAFLKSIIVNERNTNILSQVNEGCGLTPLNVACKNNTIELMKYLIKKGADVNKLNGYGETCLFSICNRNNRDYKNDIEILKYLINNGADVNKENEEGETPLHRACAWQYMDIIKILVENGADVNKGNKNGYTPLHEACRGDNKYLVKYFIENGGDVNKEDEKGRTPFLNACSNSNDNILKTIFEYGINVNVNKEDKNGESPLFVGCLKNNINIVKLLIENGADVNKEDENGETLLFHISKGYMVKENIVKYLIENGANVEKENKKGETPLFSACFYSMVNMVKILIENGANVNKENRNGETPLF